MGGRNKVIFLGGATAVGKSSFIHLAIEKLNTPSLIISADSVQVYKLINIGSAKPPKSEIEKYNYKLVDFREPDDKYNAAQFNQDAAKIISNNDCPIFIVGGSGLYMRSLIEGLFDEPDDGGETKKELNRRLKTQGSNTLFEELKDKDPETAEEIDEMNPVRIIRALEVIYKTGEKFSEMRKKRKPVIPFEHRYFILEKERDVLYETISNRVEKMLEEGLVEETRDILSRGYTRHSAALQTIGYSESCAHIDGETTSFELEALIKRNTRRYAKRQITWFAKENAIHLHGSDIDKFCEEAKRFFEL